MNKFISELKDRFSRNGDEGKTSPSDHNDLDDGFTWKDHVSSNESIDRAIELGADPDHIDESGKGITAYADEFSTDQKQELEDDPRIHARKVLSNHLTNQMKECDSSRNDVHRRHENSFFRKIFEDKSKPLLSIMEKRDELRERRNETDVEIAKLELGEEEWRRRELIKSQIKREQEIYDENYHYDRAVLGLDERFTGKRPDFAELYQERVFGKAEQNTDAPPSDVVKEPEKGRG